MLTPALPTLAAIIALAFTGLTGWFLLAREWVAAGFSAVGVAWALLMLGLICSP